MSLLHNDEPNDRQLGRLQSGRRQLRLLKGIGLRVVHLGRFC